MSVEPESHAKTQSRQGIRRGRCPDAVSGRPYEEVPGAGGNPPHPLPCPPQAGQVAPSPAGGEGRTLSGPRCRSWGDEGVDVGHVEGVLDDVGEAVELAVEREGFAVRRRQAGGGGDVCKDDASYGGAVE